MKNFGRVLTAMVTPFDANGKVDYVQTRKLTKALLSSGSDGIVVSGTTGECPTLGRDEKLCLFSEVRSAIGNQGVVIAGTGGYSTAESIEFTREAEKTGIDGCLLVVPYYNRPSQDGLYQHFKTIAEATSLPCILNVETLVKLSKVDNIIGVKESSMNFEQIARIIDGTREGFLVYSGNDSDTLPILALGGHGIISVASHLVGLQIKQMIEYFIKGKTSEAAAMHRSLLPLINALFVVSNPIPIKYALNHLGFPVGSPRLPLTEPDEKSKALIRETLKHYKIDLPISSRA
jgi:4-hydroxy-tetrahydrodipicolinate synthase